VSIFVFVVWDFEFVWSFVVLDFVWENFLVVVCLDVFVFGRIELFVVARSGWIRFVVVLTWEENF